MENKLLGLRTCIYKVPDLNAAKKWYSKAFDLEPYFDEAYYVGFNVGGYELGLLPYGKIQKENADNVVVYWGVDDIQAKYGKFINLGATSHEAPTNVGGNIEVASVRDPWSNVIGIIYNPEFKVDSVD